MNTRETMLSLVVVAALLLTGSTFSKRSSFDCYQPLFSKQSSCSLEGGGCVKLQSKTGAFGLWSQFKNLIIESTDDGIRIQCAPNCYIDIDTKHLVKSDTVDQDTQ